MSNADPRLLSYEQKVALCLENSLKLSEEDNIFFLQDMATKPGLPNFTDYTPRMKQRINICFDEVKGVYKPKPRPRADVENDQAPF